MEQFVLLFFFIFLIFFSLSLLKRISKENRERKKLPPGPWRLPIIGNLHQVGLTPHQSFLRLAQKHSPLMLLHLGRPVLKAATKFTFNNSNISFAQYGENWRQARRICVLELLSPRRVRSFKSIREQEMAMLLKDINDKASSNSPLIKSNNVLCRAVFGGRRSRFHGVMAETQSLVAGFCAADLFPGWDWIDGILGYGEKVEKNFGELNRFYEMVIDEHLNKGKGKESDDEEDLVNVLLRLHKEAPDGGFLSTMSYVKGIMAGK